MLKFEYEIRSIFGFYFLNIAPMHCYLELTELEKQLHHAKAKAAEYVDCQRLIYSMEQSKKHLEQLRRKLHIENIHTDGADTIICAPSSMLEVLRGDGLHWMIHKLDPGNTLPSFEIHEKINEGDWLLIEPIS